MLPFALHLLISDDNIFHFITSNIYTVTHPSNIHTTYRPHFVIFSQPPCVCYAGVLYSLYRSFLFYFSFLIRYAPFQFLMRSSSLSSTVSHTTQTLFLHAYTCLPSLILLMPFTKCTQKVHCIVCVCDMLFV